ncbi:hypothetical protein Moror_4026 [Moniliophthora roreri MCA 2997]|uniref:Trafficking protein particle complex II-specific subunit 65 IgD3 domain-containing protein n=2 Tax=Moniliophthora roreri TaxID=221103 RepID=V2X7W7_MONRO|nr:hypothetical protein Moror_4026 [Moniliophthora roreri MCA 2997]KAI3616113.1 hypothetical protein WG66_013905 [Moniliophthora roreri]
MSSFEQLFSSAELNVVVPNTSLEFPPSTVSADDWLENLASGSESDRKEAFFDEHIQAVLTAKIPLNEQVDEPVNPSNPPALLLSFLSHLQVSLETSYISPDVPDPAAPPSEATPRTDSLLPPRNVSLKGKKPTNLNLAPKSHHPSILPPATPNPMPASTDTDRRYAQSEGIMLCTRIWGIEGSSTFNGEDDDDAKPKEAFHLLWSDKEKLWVAAYKIVFTVAYLRLPFRLPPGVSPLLCITLSTTLREHPVAINGPNNPLAKYISSIRGTIAALAPSADAIPSPTFQTSNTQPDQSKTAGGLGEANLFGGLYSFASSSQATETGNAAEGELVLPSTRLGLSMRSSLFLLPSVDLASPTTAQISPMQTPGGHLKPPAHPTLRKSFRKTLFATSGFKVRMRTVFVPAVLFDEDDEDEGYESQVEGDKKSDAEDDPLSSGPEERTVVICVEIENEQDHFSNSSDYGGRNAGGFLVERMDVSIGGGEKEGASARLIGWDADALLPKKKKKGTDKEDADRFPLLLTPREQFNLLYAVSFLRGPEEVDGLSTLSLDGTVGTLKNEGFQRSVTLNIYGKPCYASSASSTLDFYPTTTFCTRWNCVLDLATTSLLDRALDDDYHDTPTPGGDGSKHPSLNPSALPEPASPFPISIASPRPTSFGGDYRRASLATTSNSKSGLGSSRSSSPSLTAGSLIDSRRHTLPSSGNLIKAATAGARNSLQPSMSMSPPDRRDSLGLPGATRDRRDSGGPRSSGLNSPSTYTPPSSTLQAQIPRSPTTYEAPPPPPFKDRTGSTTALSVAIPPSPSPGPSVGPPLDQMMLPPVTPAYPAFPTNTSNGSASLPPTPPSQGPYIPQGGANVSPRQGSFTGPAVDIRREKGAMMMSGIPQTPAPHVGFSGGGPPPGVFEGMGMGVAVGGLGGGVVDPIVISIGLQGGGKGKIHAAERFTLDIFVFNKSDWTRRFEISYPDPRVMRKRNEMHGNKASSGAGKGQGIVPMENRIRIGPLLPSACQSVGMDFLALMPGVHSIDTLTLTDVETGFSMNLRSVMDIVVHEAESKG